MDIMSTIIPSDYYFNRLNNYVDLSLILFYSFLTIIFSFMLTFEKSRKYITKLKLTKLKTLTKVAAQVAVQSSSKTASTTKRTLYNVFLTTQNNTLKTTIRVRRIGGKLARTIIKPLSYRRFIGFNNNNNPNKRSENNGEVTTTLSTRYTFSSLSSSTVSKLRRSGTYLLNKSKRLRFSLFNRRIKFRSTYRTYNSRVKLYKKLPLRSMSRLWGCINSIDLPVWLRKPCYLLYAWLFDCNLNEMDIEDLQEYKNLSEFFRRKLKPGARVIDTQSTLISPCDGRILHFGKVDKGYLEQVKGVNYSLKGFLGDLNWNTTDSKNKPKKQVDQQQQQQQQQLSDEDDAAYTNSLKQKSDSELYHCIIYLAPGDYHRFHSPIDWSVHYRRHFPGELFSVNPSVARWLQGLFSLNERVVYYGNWKHGFFSMTPVGATNVGSIRVYFDPNMETNLKVKDHDGLKLEKDFRLSEKTSENGIKIARGDYFGEFNLGSTIVLVFEAPKNFDFTIKQNQKVKFGQPIGLLNSK